MKSPVSASLSGWSNGMGTNKHEGVCSDEDENQQGEDFENKDRSHYLSIASSAMRMKNSIELPDLPSYRGKKVSRSALLDNYHSTTLEENNVPLKSKSQELSLESEFSDEEDPEFLSASDEDCASEDPDVEVPMHSTSKRSHQSQSHLGDQDGDTDGISPPRQVSSEQENLEIVNSGEEINASSSAVLTLDSKNDLEKRSHIKSQQVRWLTVFCH
jgi:hypothetical protein